MSKKYYYITCPICVHRVKLFEESGRQGPIPECNNCDNKRLVSDPSHLICNSCGGDMLSPWLRNKESHLYHLGLTTEVAAGFESYYLLDTHKYKFNICEECLRKLFNQFKIPPEINSYTDGGNVEFAQDQEQVEYRIWQDDGGFENAYLKGKCNSIKNCPNDAIYTILHHSESFSKDATCEEHKEFRVYFGGQLVPFIPNHLKVFV